jgi:hypothetical protein
MAGKTTKLDIGTVYRKTENASYYFRYQINGARKAVSLRTRNLKEAIAKAREIVPVVQATTTEVISAHVKQARGLASRRKSLPLSLAWETYSKHPERANPATVSERESYHSTFDEFIRFVGGDTMISEITPETADDFANHLRGKDCAVDTHNRKIRRLKKVFEVLGEYRDGENPSMHRR